MEERLDELPCKEGMVAKTAKLVWAGVRFEKGICGLSMRSSEAVEPGLDYCRSTGIGKILMQSDEETQRAKVSDAKFPPDIYGRKVLLMFPILSAGNTVTEAGGRGPQAWILTECGVQRRVIILLSLLSTPHVALRTNLCASSSLQGLAAPHPLPRGSLWPRGPSVAGGWAQNTSLVAGVTMQAFRALAWPEAHPWTGAERLPHHLGDEASIPPAAHTACSQSLPPGDWGTPAGLRGLGTAIFVTNSKAAPKDEGPTGEAG
ncbi:hypothetical protein QTO34_009973 [Cnephaeus nilssonii]|uniref:Phosphoribosyltransferase domain-containing protein n=1 Tax=Cnephaeus nilssonii TaxID=3371016 RepID=A0AA40LEI2_CNENI|nr:hypothetical protein QTO34_009973 [Eptesicus nilssonii]